MAAGAAFLAFLYLLYRVIAPSPPAGPLRSAEAGGAHAGAPAPTARSLLSPVLGEAVVRAGDQEVSRMSAALFADGSFALPVAALVGGEELTFEAEGSRAVPVVVGAWEAGDPVAFWKLDQAPQGPLPGLAPWAPALPLEWRPSLPGVPPLRVEAGTVARAGAFAFFTRPYEIRTPGIFLQEGMIVGWTFGEAFERAYLWTGRAAGRPASSIKADQFFSSVSGNSREGCFRRLLEGQGSGTSADRLEAFAKGFRQAPLLAAEDLPGSLRPVGGRGQDGRAGGGAHPDRPRGGRRPHPG